MLPDWIDVSAQRWWELDVNPVTELDLQSVSPYLQSHRAVHNPTPDGCGVYNFPLRMSCCSTIPVFFQYSYGEYSFYLTYFLC